MQRISASWPASEHIIAFTTTRVEGESLPPFDHFNLGLHVGDDIDDVLKNRARLLSECAQPDVQWLEQVHGIECVRAVRDHTVPIADACWTDEVSLVCAVMTADCLAVAFRQDDKIAVAHAGWRGLLSGVLENTLQHFDPEHTDIWLAPAIGPQVFEVGDEVRQQFVERNANSSQAFIATAERGKWLADIYQLARLRLVSSGVNIGNIYGGDYCTYTEQQRFFSYRREGVTGRMATVIYRNIPA
ncbi:MAG: peptidoglycan editing factor PgeF [Oceanospirillaceae bacterium]|nr:peptidoglycan editing factor PgeF [Oceanospirillaceae bacterium]